MKSMRDVMTTDVACCTSNDTLYEAAVKMKERNVGPFQYVMKINIY